MFILVNKRPHISWSNDVEMWVLEGYLGYPAPCPRPSYPALGPRPPVPQNFSISSTSSYLNSSHYDHVLRVYGLFKPCWLTHATCTCFKETALLFNVHLSCFVNFILCSTDKYMFKVNKLVFGNCGSFIYCQNHQFRKSYLLFDTYVFSLALYCEHIMNICFNSKFALRISIVLSSFLHAIWSALSSLVHRHFFCYMKMKTYLCHWNSETTW